MTCSAFGQPSLKVSGLAWNGLGEEEKATLQRKFMVEPLPADSFGTIIDNQAIDRSTPGTNGGAALGTMIGSAAYIDRAFSGNNNYSALANLGVAILGGVVDSALIDRPAQSQYQSRYAIRLANGSISYQDAYSVDPFRHPIGVCVSVPDIQILAEQHLCSQTTGSLRAAHMLARQGAPAYEVSTTPPAPSTPLPNEKVQKGRQEKPASIPTKIPQASLDDTVICKISNPVQLV